MLFEGKNILVGVSGSIASYKSAELVRAIQKEGGKVRVILTPSAKEFIGELTFRALTGEEVLSDWKDGKTGLEHIFWARWSDGFVIAPATATTISKIRNGIADNFLTSVVLAYDKPIVIAPAMNTKMYLNKATQENINKLKGWGYIFVEPSEGRLACDEEGIGKLADIDDIVIQLAYSIYPKPLKNKKVVITAGGTREYFDPIRYISNASSGTFGYLLAKYSYILGADVVLISAPTCLKAPYGVRIVNVVSARDMYREVLKYSKDADLIIMNSAVADFRPKNFSKEKLKKASEKPVVELEKNPDILKELGKLKKSNQILVGFAAESQNLRENAMDKLKRKNLDMIVANPLEVFSKGEHKGLIITKDGKEMEIKPTTKEISAKSILDFIIKNLLN